MCLCWWSFWFWYNGSYAWVNVSGFANYMTNSGFASPNTSSAVNVAAGDALQLYNSNKDTWSHTVLLTGRYYRDWLYTSHSSNRLNYPLSNVYPSSTYTMVRYFKF